MMKAEKGSEIITTICEYENSVAMPDNERLTYLDTCGIARLKDGNGNVKAQEAYANRCSEYLRFGHEVDLAACGAYSIASHTHAGVPTSRPSRFASASSPRSSRAETVEEFL